MMLDDGTIRRIKAFADNDSLGWVDVHGDIWNLLHAYKITMQERDRLREALEQICELEHKINEVDGLLIHTDLPKYSALEMSQIARKALIENEEALTMKAAKAILEWQAGWQARAEVMGEGTSKAKDCPTALPATSPTIETKPVAAHEKVDKEALEKAIQTAFYGLNITRDSVVKIIETYESAKRPVGGEVDEGMGSPVRYTDGTISREYEEQPNADYAIKEILHAELVIATGEPDYNAHRGAQDLLEAIRPYLREAKE